jgi:hypothetical protein
VEVWKQLGVGDKIESLLNEDRSESVLMQEVIRRGVSLTGAWYIWWERDDNMYMEDCNPPTRAAMSTASLTKNYAMARKKTCHVREGWRRPPEGKQMINIDAGFDKDSRTGIIIRDSGGVCIAAANSYLPHSCCRCSNGRSRSRSSQARADAGTTTLVATYSLSNRTAVK